MTNSQIIFWLIAIATTIIAVWGLIRITGVIREKTLDKHDYDPFSISGLAYMFVPWSVLALAFFYPAMVTDGFDQSVSLLLYSLGVILILGRFVFVTVKSNLFVALYSTVLLSVLVPLLLALALLAAMALDEAKKKKK